MTARVVAELERAEARRRGVTVAELRGEARARLSAAVAAMNVKEPG